MTAVLERPTAAAGAFAPSQLVAALPEAFRKFDPRVQLRNPVMFVVWVGSVLVTVLTFVEPSVFSILIAVWLWFTVLFANLAEAVAEGRGKAQAECAEVHLTPTEWGILELLVRHRGKLVGQRDLLQAVWGPGYGKETNYLRVYLAQLRRKLEAEPSRPLHLITEPGMGYRLEV